MKSILKHFVYVFLLIPLLVSCTKDDDTTKKALKVNKFISETMQEVYLWENSMPNINYKNESDPFVYFNKLLYTEDKWSFLTDDYEGLMGSLSGQETTYGYSLKFYWLNQQANTCYAVIQYVYDGSPADEADLKRGDILLQMNGNDITSNNLTPLIYSNNITLSLGKYSSGNIVPDDRTVTMNSRMMNLNPVMIRKTIDYSEGKIGYLLYVQYIQGFTTQLNNALRYFITEGITDLVLDLRYNPGGHVTTARHLCSALAPKDNVKNATGNGDILIRKQWNNLYQNYWQQEGEIEQLEERFDPNVVTDDLNLNLPKKRLFVLTGTGTASASELTITGLQPYMDVILIGETTVGKYVASATLRPQERKNGQWVVDSEIANWAIQPIIYAYANANANSFKDGFVPDHVVVENLILNPASLGDEQEALLAKALELITGVAPISPEKAIQSQPFVYQVAGTAFSRYDKFRGNAIEQLNINGK